MSFWDYLSLVSKETIFRKCTNISDFCPFWKTFSDDKSQKLEWQNDSWEWWNVSFSPAIRSNKNRFRLIIFLWIVIWKLKTKNGDTLKLMHLHKMPPWILHSGYFQSALKDLRRLSYQMDHIWGAPSMLKESLLLIFWEQ